MNNLKLITEKIEKAIKETYPEDIKMTLISYNNDVSAEQKIVPCGNCGKRRNIMTAPDCPVCAYEAEKRREAKEIREQNRRRYYKAIKKQ